MNRKIKFRAWVLESWDKNEQVNPKGHMDYDFYINSKDGQTQTVTFGEGESDYLNEVAIMQYTGFKDENGKEIYEGDILESKYGLEKVIFRDGGFYPFIKVGWQFASNPETIKVLGNVCESPALLNNQTTVKEKDVSQIVDLEAEAFSS